jgi:acyl-CoA thioesterase
MTNAAPGGPADQTAMALARACTEAMWAEDRASRELGMTIEDIAPGAARLAMPVTDRMVNGHGICHGGFIFALADSAFAFACNTYGDRVVAQHCSITYLRPGRLGETLVAEARERARAGRSGLYDISVTTRDGEAVAEFRGHSRMTGGQFFPEDAQHGD